MSIKVQQQIQAPDSSMKMLKAMVGIGIMCALLIVLTFEGTLPRIEKNKAEALEKAIFKVLPGISQSSKFLLNSNNEFNEQINAEEVGPLVYAGYDDNDELLGVAVEASGQGYADVIRILYGYNPEDQKIIGFYVLESKETPGLGDKIEKEDSFLDNFRAMDVALVDDLSGLKNEVITVKQGTKTNSWEVDGITGATISSRAIGDMIGKSIQDWAPKIYKNKEALMKQ